VLYTTRVVPLIAKALKAKSIGVGPGGEVIASSRFLPDLQWLTPDFVSQQLGSSGGSGKSRGKASPGTHGHALTSVAVGSQTLSAGTTAHIPSNPAPVFSVTFLNGGSNDETNVRVKVSIAGAGKPLDTVKTVPRTTAGQSTTVSVTPTGRVPVGQTVTIKVTVEPVLGETKNDNNSLTFQAIFSPG